jgi:hypothetical protein
MLPESLTPLVKWFVYALLFLHLAAFLFWMSQLRKTWDNSPKVQLQDGSTSLLSKKKD